MALSGVAVAAVTASTVASAVSLAKVFGVCPCLEQLGSRRAQPLPREEGGGNAKSSEEAQERILRDLADMKQRVLRAEAANSRLSSAFREEHSIIQQRLAAEEARRREAESQAVALQERYERELAAEKARRKQAEAARKKDMQANAVATATDMAAFEREEGFEPGSVNLVVRKVRQMRRRMDQAERRADATVGRLASERGRNDTSPVVATTAAVAASAAASAALSERSSSSRGAPVSRPDERHAQGLPPRRVHPGTSPRTGDFAVWLPRSWSNHEGDQADGAPPTMPRERSDPLPTSARGGREAMGMPMKPVSPRESRELVGRRGGPQAGDAVSRDLRSDDPDAAGMGSNAMVGTPPLPATAPSPLMTRGAGRQESAVLSARAAPLPVLSARPSLRSASVHDGERQEGDASTTPPGPQPSLPSRGFGVPPRVIPPPGEWESAARLGASGVPSTQAQTTGIGTTAPQHAGLAAVSESPAPERMGLHRGDDLGWEPDPEASAGRLPLQVVRAAEQQLHSMHGAGVSSRLRSQQPSSARSTAGGDQQFFGAGAVPHRLEGTSESCRGAAVGGSSGFWDSATTAPLQEELDELNMTAPRREPIAAPIPTSSASRNVMAMRRTGPHPPTQLAAPHAKAPPQHPQQPQQRQEHPQQQHQHHQQRGTLLRSFPRQESGSFEVPREHSAPAAPGTVMPPPVAPRELSYPFRWQPQTSPTAVPPLDVVPVVASVGSAPCVVTPRGVTGGAGAADVGPAAVVPNSPMRFGPHGSAVVGLVAPRGW